MMLKDFIIEAEKIISEIKPTSIRRIHEVKGMILFAKAINSDSPKTYDEILDDMRHKYV